MIQKNQNKQIIVLLFLLIFFAILNTNNTAFCEESVITEVTEQTSSGYDYKKIFFYTMGCVALGLLLYYAFQGDSGPENFNFSDITKTDIPNSIVKSAKVQEEVVTKLTVKDCYMQEWAHHINEHLANLTDQILPDFQAFNLDIPLFFHMWNTKLNAFYFVSNADLVKLYSLPSDSFVAFAHYQSPLYYQIITSGELISVIAKYNITNVL